MASMPIEIGVGGQSQLSHFGRGGRQEGQGLEGLGDLLGLAAEQGIQERTGPGLAFCSGPSGLSNGPDMLLARHLHAWLL